jgi:phenylpropionate dioxygenase-like ring-hydroxylating dioxygenase large terminal subunit
VRARAYPVVERNGILFAYLGEGAPPAFPEFDCFLAPGSHTFAFKGLIECNWLQALEVGIDPAHASFLHRFFEDEDPAAGYGKQFRATSADSDMPMTRLMREFERPRLDFEPTEFGLRIFALRDLDQARSHIRVTNLLFPQAFVIPLSSEMTITQWHVPVDDENNYWYAIFTSFGQPVDKAAMRAQRLQLYQLPDYRPRIGRANDYGYDPAEQRTRTYTGMGDDINVHDQWAVESQGRIHDRSREHLGTTDKVIAANRRLLLKSIAQAERGERPLMVLDAAAAQRLRGPATVDGIGPRDGWQSYWQEHDRQKRRNAPWAAAIRAA